MRVRRDSAEIQAVLARMNELTGDRLAPPAPAASDAAAGRLKAKPRRGTERSERSAERLGRRIATLAVASIFLNLVLGSALFVILNRPPTVFLLGEMDGKTYQARGPVEETDVMRTLMEKFARRYVRERETVDLVSDQERHEWVKRNSAAAVWKVFEREMFESGIYQKAARGHTTWSVKVVTAWQSNEANEGIWSLEIIKTHFWLNKQRGPEKPWIIELKLGRDGREKTEAEQLDNPAALYVMAYSAREKELVTEGKNP